MGWKCKKCKNTELFTEVNAVETDVYQEKATTKIKKIKNRKIRRQGALNVWCRKCDSENVEWIDVKDQGDSYLEKK
ncbi:hypothetical protein GF327_07650 [Candidatus Woesearchaeota archaeon]|nr:hypothetical protein [Candidatus Woesearchaeota archaeon]